MADRVAAAGLEFAGMPSVPAWPDGLAQDDDLDRLDAMLHGPEAEHDISPQPMISAPMSSSSTVCRPRRSEPPKRPEHPPRCCRI